MTSSDDYTATPRARRVLAFTSTFLPGYKGGGPVKSMVHILDNLPDSVKVTLVTADRDLGDSLPYHGLSGRVVHRGPHEVYYMNPRNPRHWLALKRWTRGRTVDLLYVNSLWSPFFTIFPLAAHRLGLLHSRAVLLAPRGELSPGALGIKPLKKWIFLRVWAPLLREIDPTWEASTEMDAAEIHQGFPWAKIIVQVDSPGDAAREDIISSRNRARFVYISRISEKKNLQFGLKALRFVKCEVDFDIYGPLEDANYWTACQLLIDELPLNIRATYRGMLRPDKVQETFAQYDGFILPTLGENFGHVISESLSAGCPVICSQQTPWTAVLRQGGGAALPELNVQRWAEEISRRAKMTSSQRDHSKRDAIAAYAKWRSQQDNTSALVLALDGMLADDEIDCDANAGRIALVTQGYQTAGGVQTVARWLDSGLREAGYRVDVFDLATSRTDTHSRRLGSPASWFRSTLLVADSSDLQVTHVGANGVELEPLRYLPRAELSAELNRYDLVQVVSGGPALALAAAQCRSPIVLQVATTAAWERESQLATTGPALALWRGAMTMATSLMERRAIRLVDAVLVENSQMQEFVNSLGQTRVVLAPPGVDTKRFTPRIGGWDPTGYLLSVCRLNDARKGLDRMIRSYALMTTQRPEVPALVLAGREKLPKRLMELIVELGLADRVSVLSDVPQAELPLLYRGASVYLQTSHEEGLGISVIEAMACGLPVVSTETAGTRETVISGDTGWLVSQGPELEKVMAERTLAIWNDDAAGMSRRARSRTVSLFSDKVALSPYLKIYDELLNARPEGR